MGTFSKEMEGLHALKWGDVNRSGVVSGNIHTKYFGSDNFGFICEWETVD